MSFRSLFLLLFLSSSSSLFLLGFSHTTSSSSSIVFTTLGRSRYTFDIFAAHITPTTPSSPAVTLHNELQLTDGVSVNYNGFFPSIPSSLLSNSSDDYDALLYVTEAGGTPTISLDLLPSSAATSNLRREALQHQHQQFLPSRIQILDDAHDPIPSMKDRPSISGDHLIYVSTHHPSHSPRQPWAAVYSTHLPTLRTRRLTPSGVADFSPSVSPSGVWTAVASSGARGWSGEVQELNTSIHLFRTRDGSDRVELIAHGGWPCWADDSILYFHRRGSDGWWSVYRATITTTTAASPSVVSVDRITPPGFHAFTPAASAGAPWLLAVATRRATSQFRHIELVHLAGGGGSEGNTYIEVTRPISPNSHHYNPFFSPDASRIGYHRCRGGRGGGSPPLLLENIRSPSPEAFSLLRIDGLFPSFSPDSSRIAYVQLPGLFVVNSDGSGEPREVFTGNAFGTAWDWKRRGVIYTSYGPGFATESTGVDIISITLNDDDGQNSEPTIKKLTVNGDNNAFPSPSPDGRWVVFRSGRSGHKNLYVMDAVGGETAGLRRLTEGPWSDTMCNWSPDGEWIAFASDMYDPGGGSFAIYMVHPNGTGLRRVVHSGDGGRTNHPWFSPDSKSLVFTSDYAGVSAEPIANPHHFQPYGDIFTVNIDGSDIRRLTHNSYEDGPPTWTPYYLKPADVAESLHGNDLCSFDDCHWLAVFSQLNSITYGTSC